MSSQESTDPMLTARDKAEDITFAVELKFLIRQDVKYITSEYGHVRKFVPHRPEELRNSMTESETRLWQDNWEAVARAINAIPGVDAIGKHQLQAQRIEELWKTHWMVYKANSACPPYMTYFQRNPDLPVFDANAPDYQKYVWTPVEICSPISLWSQKTEALERLTTVLETLNKQFDAVANPSTECHVHVGRADGKFYSLKTMKKLATLLWLSEPILRVLKNPASPNYDHHYTWSYAMRENSRVGMAIDHELPNGQTIDDLYTGRSHDFDAFLTKLMEVRVRHLWLGESHTVLQEQRKALRAIWRAANHAELGHMLRGPERKLRRLGFNFHALEAEAKGESIPQTIEFRFFEGFIDSKIVPAWVRLCGELIDVVVEQEDDEGLAFYEVVAGLLSMPKDWPLNAQFIAFMNVLGRARVPLSVLQVLRAIVVKHYPPQRRAEHDLGSPQCHAL